MKTEKKHLVNTIQKTNLKLVLFFTQKGVVVLHLLSFQCWHHPKIHFQLETLSSYTTVLPEPWPLLGHCQRWSSLWLPGDDVLAALPILAVARGCEWQGELVLSVESGRVLGSAPPAGWTSLVHVWQPWDNKQQASSHYWQSNSITLLCAPKGEHVLLIADPLALGKLPRERISRYNRNPSDTNSHTVCIGTLGHVVLYSCIDAWALFVSTKTGSTKIAYPRERYRVLLSTVASEKIRSLIV